MGNQSQLCSNAMNSSPLKMHPLPASLQCTAVTLLCFHDLQRTVRSIACNPAKHAAINIDLTTDLGPRFLLQHRFRYAEESDDKQYILVCFRQHSTHVCTHGGSHLLPITSDPVLHAQCSQFCKEPLHHRGAHQQTDLSRELSLAVSTRATRCPEQHRAELCRIGKQDSRI